MQLSLFRQEPNALVTDRINILLSLHDEYFQKMVEGSKKYEYRFTFPKSKTRAYIYVPKKIKEIRGYFELEKPISGSAEEISAIYSNCGDGSYETMFNYIGKKKVTYAMKVEHVVVFDTAIKYVTLKQAFPDFFAPQSYIILDNKPALLRYIMEFGK